MTKQYILCAALAGALVAGCGGGSGGGTSGGGRIEPLDTALQSAPAGATPAAAASRMPQGAAVPRIELGPLTGAKIAAPQDSSGAPVQIGQGRAVQATASPDDLAGQLHWNALADGTQVAALAFSAEGAQAMRLGVLARRVPAGAVLRFYGTDDADVVEMTAAQLDEMRKINEDGGVAGDAARMVWGPDTAGSVSMLEVQLPAGVNASQLQLAVPQLSHLTRTAQQALQDTSTIGASGSCNLDVRCSADLDTESRAVAHMVFNSGGDTYVCSGTLMNDTKKSRTPYFLTANHCISTQASATTLITYWFFRAASCNSSPQYDAAMTRLTNGAKLLYTETKSDGTLLQLNSQPPAKVVYAGSYYGTTQSQNTGVTGVHHPKGDLQKYSTGSITGYATCSTANNSLSCSTGTASSSSSYRVSFTKGVVEGGSSGSGIFVKQGNTRYLVGTLTGGAASCSNQGGAEYYGRFDLLYSRGMKNYLNP